MSGDSDRSPRAPRGLPDGATGPRRSLPFDGDGAGIDLFLGDIAEAAAGRGRGGHLGRSRCKGHPQGRGRRRRPFLSRRAPSKWLRSVKRPDQLDGAADARGEKLQQMLRATPEVTLRPRRPRNNPYRAPAGRRSRWEMASTSRTIRITQASSYRLSPARASATSSQVCPSRCAAGVDERLALRYQRVSRSDGMCGLWDRLWRAVVRFRGVPAHLQVGPGVEDAIGSPSAGLELESRHHRRVRIVERPVAWTRTRTSEEGAGTVVAEPLPARFRTPLQ